MSRAIRFAAIIATPLPGRPRIGIQTRGDVLSQLQLLPGQTRLLPSGSPVAQRIVSRLEAYFADGRADLTQLPVSPVGTAYQQRVWHALRTIQAGDSISYGELALLLGSGARAVASACRANPVPLVIPCHRVTAAYSLGGYMGRTEGREVAIKEWLLNHEQAA